MCQREGRRPRLDISQIRYYLLLMSLFFLYLQHNVLCILCCSGMVLLWLTEFPSSLYPSISYLSNVIFLCGALITTYQKQTYPRCIILYKLQNMSCHKADMMDNGRTLCHFSRGIKMALNTTSAFSIKETSPSPLFLFHVVFWNSPQRKMPRRQKSQRQDIVCLSSWR